MTCEGAPSGLKACLSEMFEDGIRAARTGQQNPTAITDFAVLIWVFYQYYHGKCTEICIFYPRICKYLLYDLNKKYEMVL